MTTVERTEVQELPARPPVSGNARLARIFTPTAKRLITCLIGSLVLAIMWGPQEGSSTDYGYAVRTALFSPRIIVFLLLGVIAFFAITFWPRVVPFLTRPGVWPLTAGAVTVLAAMTLMHWYDPAGDAKFGAASSAASSANGLAPISAAFFSWLAWAQLAVVFLVCAVAIITEIKPLAWLGAALAVVAAVITYISHHALVTLLGGVDHSLGAGTAVVGYVVMAGAAVIVAVSKKRVANTRAFVARLLDWRPGLPLVILGLVVGIVAFTTATWFSPQNKDATIVDTHDLFVGSGLASIALTYLAWLGLALFVVAVLVSGAATYLRSRPLGWIAALVGLVGIILTLVTLYDISQLGAQSHFDSATGPWQNLGTGGWLACIAFTLMGGAGFVAAAARREKAVAGEMALAPSSSDRGVLRSRSAANTLLLVVVAIALFFPPTMTPFWQQVLVSEIGIYVLLAIGLNVVVGWAGLLDLGYIAFYAIGSYTTAYLVGSLPVKPPSWLHMTPLLAIPFAIGICLLAGVVLGAPTLRLRGDYLAIVTLGFGEIIYIIAVNAQGVTNGSQGPPNQVPHPVIHLGPIQITWGLNQLQYWYLLLFFVVVVVILFRRLENSRLGRSWAAIREDEVAAQATGINTYRVKLLAFAIGASTSGLAGVFFASQVGFFTPDNFVLANSILVVAYVVFGGMGSIPGVMAGAALLTWLPEFLKDQVPAPDRQMWIGVALVAMMIFRPAGLFPARRRQAELGGLERAPAGEVSAVPASEGM